jgi:TPR repeat protein
MPTKRKRENDETKSKNELIHKNLTDLISSEKFKDLYFDEKVEELCKLNLSDVIQYIDSCNQTNKKFFKEFIFMIAVIYSMGVKLEQNSEKSIAYIKMSANLGLPFACYILACNLETGYFCEKNIVESFKYFKIAADNNNIRSQYRISQMYETGIGCEKNLEESFKYSKLCADNTIDCKELVSIFDNNHNKLIEINKDYMLRAKYNVGVLYFKGIGVIKNVTEGIKYLKIAADEKFPNAIYSLYKIYYDGREVEKNFDESFKYLMLGVEIRDMISIYDAIRFYYNHQLFDIPQNIEEGFKHIKIFLQCVTIDNIYDKVNKKFTSKGNYLCKIIYEILLQNDMELPFVQELLSKYKVFSSLNSLLQFKLNKKKLPNYYKNDICIICFEENITTQLFDCLGHYYCQNCSIKIQQCCLCKSSKRCSH